MTIPRHADNDGRKYNRGKQSDGNFRALPGTASSTSPTVGSGDNVCHPSEGPSLKQQELPGFPFHFQTEERDSCTSVLESLQQGFLTNTLVGLMLKPTSVSMMEDQSVGNTAIFTCRHCSPPCYKCVVIFSCFNFCCQHTSYVTIHLQVLQILGHTLGVMVVLFFY